MSTVRRGPEGFDGTMEQFDEVGGLRKAFDRRPR